jgi:hypothetical protein
MRNPFLITGCPRSGTKYTAEVFGRAGYDVRHEQVGVDGCVSWYHGSPHAYGQGGRFTPKFRAVVLQIRHPVQTISSLRVLSLYSLAHIINPTLGISKSDWPPDGTLLRGFFWLRWNEWIETALKPTLTVQVEQLPQRWLRLCAVVGVQPPVMPEVETDTNMLPHSATDWDEIYALSPDMCNELQRAAARYGYTA